MYEMSYHDQAGLGVLCLRVAPTDAKGARINMDTFSTVIPIGVALSAAENVSTMPQTGQARFPISACIITYNEADRITETGIALQATIAGTKFSKIEALNE